MAKIKDDVFQIIEDDISKIQNRPSMYIASLGSAGCLHLCKELIDNNRDECIKESSPGNMIDIEITNKGVKSSDNGRGIPTSLVRKIHETNQAGSNMTRAHGNTSGENGTGTACLVALSNDMIVISKRPQEKKILTVVYKNGKCVDEKLEDYNGKESGMTTYFTPSKKILGVDTIPVDELVEWIEDFNYTLPSGIRMKYTVNGDTKLISHKTLDKYFDKFIKPDKRLCTPLNFEFEGEVNEEFNDKVTTRKFRIEASVVYAESRDDDIRKSWMNMIYTSQNGSHVNGVINGLSKYLTEKAIKKKPNLKNEDLKRDVLANLQVVVKGECNMAHMFSSQAKAHVFPKTLLNAITKAAYEKLSEMPQSIINELVDVVIANNRVRREGEKARDVSSATKAIKTWKKPDSYIPCSPHAKHTELFLVEGLSAGGGLRAARNSETQAILQFRGKSLNPWDATLDQILKSEPWLNLTKVCECGIGPSFDIRKLKFDRILEATDADIDGLHIRVLWNAFFLKWMPEIITSGRLFICEPPLYKLINGKDTKYVATQNEYINECINSIGDIDISFNGKSVNVVEFIKDTFDYNDNLRELSKEKGVNRYLLEHIANGFVKYDNVNNFINHIDEWLRSLTGIYREIGFDHKTNQIRATIDLHDNLVVLNEDLMLSLDYIIRTQSKYDLLITFASGRFGKKTTRLSGFFELIEDVYPKIADRYKGLGSTDAVVSREIIMDPKTRRIKRVTVDDIREASAKMGIYIGDGKQYINQRKDMLMNFKFTKNDIDT